MHGLMSVTNFFFRASDWTDMAQISHLITYHRYLCVPITRGFLDVLSYPLTQAVLPERASHFPPCE